MREGLSEQLTAAINKEKLREILIRENRAEKVGGIAMLYYDTLSKIHIYEYAGSATWFDGKSYTVVKKEDLESAIFTSMRELQVSDGVLNEKFQSMMKTIWRDLSRRNFEPTRRKLCFCNCVLDVDNHQAVPFSPEHWVTNRINYDYDPKAECPKWEKFLAEVLPDPLVRGSLQGFLGLMFVVRSELKIEKMAILLGTGSNGKSVVYETITELIGKHNTTTFELGDLTSASSTREYKIAAIEGKIINYCSELSKNELNGSKIKGIVSGEATMARDPYGKNFTARNLPIMICNANEMPTTSDHTVGYFRRLVLVPFNVFITAEKQNLHLSTELRSELSGILNWVLTGLKRMEANGYKIYEPDEVRDAVLKYEIDSNSILKFIEESEFYDKPIYKTHPWAEISAMDFYGKYKTYCNESGNIPFSLVKFGEKLVEKGFTKKRTQNGWKYLYYKMPLPDDYDTLVAEGKITMEKTEYMRLIGYKYLGKSVGVSEWPEEVVKVQKEYVDSLLF